MQRCPPPLITFIDGVRVECHDLHHQLVVEGRKLSPRSQVYFFVRVLVVQVKACEAGQVTDRLVSYAELCRETGTSDLAALRVIACEARQELRRWLFILKEYGRGIRSEAPAMSRSASLCVYSSWKSGWFAWRRSQAE